jgi:hypothetical protein
MRHERIMQTLIVKIDDLLDVMDEDVEEE